MPMCQSAACACVCRRPRHTVFMDRLRPEVIVPLSRRPRLLIALFAAMLLAPMLALYGIPWRGHRIDRRVYVRIETDPPGAAVRVGDADRVSELTPCGVILPRGPVARLRLSLPGYRDTVVRIVPDGGDTQVKAVLFRDE